MLDTAPPAPTPRTHTPQVRRNLHVVLCCSADEQLRSRVRAFPALLGCTTCDWFLPWPHEVRVPRVCVLCVCV